MRKLVSSLFIALAFVASAASAQGKIAVLDAQNAILNTDEAQQALAKGRFQAPEDPGPSDRRFSNPLWDTHPYFNYVKQQYLINAEAIAQAVEDIEDMDETEKRRLRYFAHQIVDMFSPTNFLATNPDALQRAVETEGDSLVKGMENLVADLEANNGELVVRLADESAFEIGRNIATAEGKVVYRNRMMELIQYSPTTEKVHETPVVLFPPWIKHTALPYAGEHDRIIISFNAAVYGAKGQLQQWGFF